MVGHRVILAVGVTAGRLPPLTAQLNIAIIWHYLANVNPLPFVGDSDMGPVFIVTWRRPHGNYFLMAFGQHCGLDPQHHHVVLFAKQLD